MTVFCRIRDDVMESSYVNGIIFEIPLYLYLNISPPYSQILVGVALCREADTAQASSPSSQSSPHFTAPQSLFLSSCRVYCDFALLHYLHTESEECVSVISTLRHFLTYIMIHSIMFMGNFSLCSRPFSFFHTESHFQPSKEPHHFTRACKVSRYARRRRLRVQIFY